MVQPVKQDEEVELIGSSYRTTLAQTTTGGGSVMDVYKIKIIRSNGKVEGPYEVHHKPFVTSGQGVWRIGNVGGTMSDFRDARIEAACCG